MGFNVGGVLIITKRREGACGHVEILAESGNIPLLDVLITRNFGAWEP